MEGSTFMSDVNEDVLHEILIRLPDSGSAIRASTVCKRWFSIIHNRNFINTFDRRHGDSNTDSMKFTILCRWVELLEYPRNSARSHDLSFPADGKTNCLDFLPWKPRMAKIEASCGSLLLLCLLAKGDLCVCNPLTKQWRFLPPLPRSYFWWNCGLITAPKGGFKVVAADPDDYTGRFHAKVFCSESKNWTETFTVLPQRVQGCGQSTAASANGVLYWAEGENECRGVVAFDPAAGAAWLVGLPGPGFDRRGRRANHVNVRLGEVRGRLRLSQMVWRNRAHRLRVWELEDCRAGEWRLVQEATGLRLPEQACVLGFHPDDGGAVFLRCDLADVCRYDFAGGKVKKVGQLPFYCNSQEAEICSFQAFTLAYPPSWPKPIPRFRDKRRKKPNSMKVVQKRRRIN